MTQAAPQLAELREQQESLRLQVEVAQLEQDLRGLKQLHEWGPIVDRSEFVRDMSWGNQDSSRITLPSDRKQGDNAPFWQSESELAVIRGIGRHLHATDEVAMAALGNLSHYVIGSGFTYTAEPKDDGDERVAAEVQALVDEFISINEWSSGYQSLADVTETDLESELFLRSRRDGEAFVALLPTRDGQVVAEVIEPDEVTEPDQPRKLEDYHDLPLLDWKYGVGKEPNRPARKYGYFVCRCGDGDDWSYYPASQVVHLRCNVDRAVARGLSDYYGVYQDLEKAAKLLDNTLTGAAIQAAIAYIREHATGPTAEVAGARTVGDATRRVMGQNGVTRDLPVRKFSPGTVLDVRGAKYHLGPMGTPQGPTYVEVLQGAYRVIGTRWHTPEYMISGDASNANFSSTLVAESPFVKAALAKQWFYGRGFSNAIWKALRLYCEAGRISTPFEQLRRRVEIKVTYPDIAVRDQQQDHQRRREEHEAGLLSLETWAEETGRDYEQEQERRRQERSTMPITSDPANPLPVRSQFEEARRLLWEGYP